MGKMLKKFVVYYKGEPFRAGFAWYDVYKKRWEYTTKKYAISALKDAKQRANNILNTQLYSNVKEFWEKIDWSQFEIIEMGIVSKEKINLEE